MRPLAASSTAAVIAFGALLGSHFALISAPFYWDELGQFIPAALDIYHRLSWVPYTTVPNVHPPGVMAYLALVWRLFGFSIPLTRTAMLAVAACGLLAQWRLARVLTGERGPALLASALLFCSPLFFSQSEMAQLDMPAMVLTTAALVLFFDERLALCATLCCAAVMVKETAAVAPALFGWLLLRKGRPREAFLFALPLLPLAIWLAVLKRSTGHFFGSPEFTDYNLFYPLHPVRLSLAAVRRAYYLFIGSGHIIGSVALVPWLRKERPGWKWRVAFLFVLLHVIVITVLGGAVLERYLLPALPVLYCAFAAAIWRLSPRLRTTAAVGLIFCLLIACVVNPLYPFPLENNLAWTTFVQLEKQTAEYAEQALPQATIATSFPMAGALRRPEMGFVSRPLRVLEINDFRASSLEEKVRGRADALIEYSTLWDPLHTLDNHRWVGILKRYYGYAPQAAIGDIAKLTGMRPAFRICAAGQCFDVYSTPRGHRDSGAGPVDSPVARNVSGGPVIE